jgi:PPOX class probable F420-dependent enzyme
MDDRIAKFMAKTSTGSLITVRPNGSAHVARVTVGVVDGKIWSTGTQSRVRTKHLRANPRATYFVFDSRSRGWLGLEGVITIHDGPDAPQKCLAVQRAVGREPEDVDAFIKDMVAQERVAFELELQRFYGAFEE